MIPTTKSYHVIYMMSVLSQRLEADAAVKRFNCQSIRSFLRKKTSFGYCFSETNILILCTSFVLHKVLKTFLEVPSGSSQSLLVQVDSWPMSLAPTLENQSGLWKSKTSERKKSDNEPDLPKTLWVRIKLVSCW